MCSSDLVVDQANKIEGVEAEIVDIASFNLPLGLWFPTERAWYARAEGTDLDGKEVIVEGEELMARCIQHECDHLEGRLYLNRLDRKNRAQAMKELCAQGL